jgi:hypothetical protein
MAELERCSKEIAEAERNLRAGHRQVEAILQQLMDWSIERRLLSERRAAPQKEVTHGT